MGAVAGQVVDHINRNPLDNRRENLRLCTQSMNQMNRAGNSTKRTSVFKGVTRQGKRWKAQIGFCGNTHYIGMFDSEADAAYAYDSRAKILFGQYAVLNFPEKFKNRGYTGGDAAQPSNTDKSLTDNDNMVLDWPNPTL